MGDPVYGILTQAVGTSECTVTPGASVGVAIHRWEWSENGAVAAAGRARLSRATGGATPTAITPEKFNSRSRAADAAGVSNWGTAPTVSGNPLVVQGFVRTSPANAICVRWTPPNPRCLPYEDAGGVRFMSDMTVTNTQNHWIRFSEPQGSGQCCDRIRGRRSTKPGYFPIHEYSYGFHGIETNPLARNIGNVHNYVSSGDWPQVIRPWNINLYGEVPVVAPANPVFEFICSDYV